MLEVSSHLKPAFDLAERSKKITAAVMVLQKIEFDTIVVTGISGTVPGAIIAHLMGKQLAVVRREKERTVGGGGPVEGHLGGRWIVIDDFISTGGTLRRVVKKYSDACAGELQPRFAWGDSVPPQESEYLGVYLFNQESFIKAGMSADETEMLAGTKAREAFDKRQAEKADRMQSMQEWNLSSTMMAMNVMIGGGGGGKGPTLGVATGGNGKIMKPRFNAAGAAESFLNDRWSALDLDTKYPAGDLLDYGTLSSTFAKL